MQKTIQLLGLAPVRAFGVGVLVVTGAWLAQKKIRRFIEIDNIVEKLGVSTNDGQLGRREVIAIIAESKEVVAKCVIAERLRRRKAVRRLLQNKEEGRYAVIILASVRAEMKEEEKAINIVCEHLGVSEESLARNVKYFSENLEIGREVKHFSQKLKEEMLASEVRWYAAFEQSTNKLVADSLDFLSFREMLASQDVQRVVRSNEPSFKAVLSGLYEAQATDVSELLMCLMILAYELIEKQTGYSENVIKIVYLRFQDALESNGDTHLYEAIERQVLKFLVDNPSSNK